MAECQFKNIVILTGAGISAESGIATFRDKNGLWENHDVMEVASPDGFRRDPELVYRFYNERRKQLLSKEVIPNPAHEALARLEKEFQGKMTIITQNVDDLHERGGSQNVLHMHGELLKIRCQRTRKVFEEKGTINSQSICECCNLEGTLRPHIVWFGEVPMFMDKIENLLREADLFVSIGTSGQVYPASMFVQMAKLENDCVTIEANLEKTQISWNFDKSLLGKAGDIVPGLVDKILAGEL
ncbi:MAG: NAD-dependent deacylase [Deltaproteobacteria bacterium]|nr:MAG: NAD-dependent deacylase [Deltaproteobacteria bacterium]